jgi:hypothetical protein
VSCLSLLCTDSLMATTSPLRNSTCGWFHSPVASTTA